MSLAIPAPCDGASASGKCHAAKHPRLVLATCILASSLAFIDGSVLNVALPAIGRSFHAGTAEVQWVINAFMLPLSALLLLGGAAGDLYGRRRTMLWGIALFTARLDALRGGAEPRQSSSPPGRCRGWARRC